MLKYAYMNNLHIANTAVFLAVAGLHALRLVYGSPVTVGSVEIALWVSIAAVIGALALAAFNWRAIHAPGKAEWLKLLLGLFVVDAAVVFYSWTSGLSYWGVEAGQFSWVLLFDLIVIVFLYWSVKRAKK